MEPHPERKLLQLAEVASLLQLTDGEIEWLVNTGQLQAIRICGQVRFDTKDIFQLIETYKVTQGRRE